MKLTLVSDTPELVPLVVGIHGGGWISGSKEDYHELTRVITGAGCAVALPNYRLAPLHPHDSHPE